MNILVVGGSVFLGWTVIQRLSRSELEPYVAHWHLSDAKGIDGEGLEFGKGEIKNFSYFFGQPGMKIIEIWQGHLNNGTGFLKGLKKLFDQHETL